jgi:antitoxin HicB
MVYYCTIKLEDGLYGIEFPDLPNIITVGTTQDEALALATESLNAALESDVARGFPLPVAATGPGKGLYPIELSPTVELAWELRRLRGDRPQSEVAERLGLPYQSYQRLESARGNPTVKTLEKVAKAFGKKLEIRIA